MFLRNILLVLLVIEIIIIILWKLTRAKTGSVGRDRALETDLRLTYKRYMEIYPTSTISYPEYKQMQARKAYKRSVSSMKIERMVR